MLKNSLFFTPTAHRELQIHPCSVPRHPVGFPPPQADEPRHQKQLQQKAYFQALTSQVHEKRKCSAGPTESRSPNPDGSQPSLLPWPAANVRLSKYHRKYQIENFTAVCVNGSQILGGALQRDEWSINKQRKQEQQTAMKHSLQAQIEEKKRISQASNAQQEDTGKSSVDSIKSTTADATPTADAATESSQEPPKRVDYLSQLCQQLINEQEKLKSQIDQQEGLIADLKVPDKRPKSNLPRVAHSASHHKSQGELEKLAAIDLKIENARKKRLENQKKTRNENRPKRLGGIMRGKTELKDPLPVGSTVTENQLRMQTAFQPVTASFGPSSSLPVRVRPETPDRHNLDTAGKSRFLYPDTAGVFPTGEDEIDRFLQGKQWTSSRDMQPANTLGKHRITFTSFEPSRRTNKPMMAKGLPLDIFRVKS